MNRSNGEKAGKVVAAFLIFAIAILGGSLAVLGIQGKLFSAEPKPTVPKPEKNYPIPSTASNDEGEEDEEPKDDEGPLTWVFSSEVYTAAKKSETPKQSEKSKQPENSEQHEDEGSDQPEEQPDYISEQNLHEDGVLYMQDVTQDIVDGLNYGDTITVVDNRTGVEYEVVKLNDGGQNTTLYMTTDLKLGSTERPMLLTPANTNIYSNYLLPKSSEPKAYNENNPIEETIAIDGDSYLYSPAAAVAGSQLEDFGDNTVIYNINESICPKGWRLPIGSEDYDYTDGQTETDFNSEIWTLEYWEQSHFNNYDLEFSFATSTSSYAFDWDDETQTRVPLWLAMDNSPYNSSSIMQVRCMFGEPRVRRLNLTVDFNGGHITERDANWVPHDFTKIDHYKTWLGGGEDIFMPGYWVIRDGYKFLGYSKNKNATTPEYYDDGSWDLAPGHYLKASDYLGGTHTTIYAIWKKLALVTFNANGGEFYTGSETHLGTYDPEQNTWSNGGYDVPYLEGHELLGWATTQDATEPEYYPYPEEGQKGLNEITADITLYAVWN